MPQVQGLRWYPAMQSIIKPQKVTLQVNSPTILPESTADANHGRVETGQPVGPE